MLVGSVGVGRSVRRTVLGGVAFGQVPGAGASVFQPVQVVDRCIDPTIKQLLIEWLWVVFPAQWEEYAENFSTEAALV